MTVQPLSPRDKVRVHRSRMRANGLRPIQFWVPDMDLPRFRKAAHIQSAMIAASDAEPDDQAFIDVISDHWSDDD